MTNVPWVLSGVDLSDCFYAIYCWPIYCEAGEGKPGEISRQPKSISVGVERGAGNHSGSVGVAASQRKESRALVGCGPTAVPLQWPKKPQLHHQGHPCVKHPVWSPTAQVQISASPSPPCVTVGKSLPRSETWFPFEPLLWIGDYLGEDETRP